MELIIVFIIIGVISNILKALGNNRPNQPGQAGRRIEPQMNFPDLDSSRKSQNNPFGMENGIPEKWRNPSRPSVDAAEEEPFRENVSDRTAYTDASQGAAVPVQTVPSNASQGVDEAPKSRMQLPLTSDKLLDGIILSEILQPPISRRK